MFLKYLLPGRKLPQGEELERVATELGVSLHETYGSRSLNEPELQRRILEAIRAQRDSWLWLLVLISALCLFDQCLSSLGRGVENVLRQGIESTAMKFFGVEISIISVKFDLKSMVEAIEKVLFEWRLRLTSRSHVQIGPPRYSIKIDRVGVYYSLVDKYFEGRDEVRIGDVYCTSRKLRYRFRECKGNLRETRDYPGLTTRLVCQNCGETYPPKDRDQLAEKITADLRRKGTP